MPNLDDMGPVLPLGGLFVLGNQGGSGVMSRQSTGGENGTNFLAGGFAAGSAEYVVNQARDAAGLDSSTVPDELGQALLGVGISHADMVPRNKAMSRAIHYNVATQAFQDLGVTLGDLAGDVNLGDGGNGSGAPSNAMSTPSAANPSVGSNKVVY